MDSSKPEHCVRSGGGTRPLRQAHPAKRGLIQGTEGLSDGGKRVSCGHSHQRRTSTSILAHPPTTKLTQRLSWGTRRDRLGDTPSVSCVAGKYAWKRRGETLHETVRAASLVLGRRYTHLRSTRTRLRLGAAIPTQGYTETRSGTRRACRGVLCAVQSDCAPEAHLSKRQTDAAGKCAPAEDRSCRFKARRNARPPPGVETAETAHATNPRVLTWHPGGGCPLRLPAQERCLGCPIGACTGRGRTYKDGGDDATDLISLRHSSHLPRLLSSGSAPRTPPPGLPRRRRRAVGCPRASSVNHCSTLFVLPVTDLLF